MELIWTTAAGLVLNAPGDLPIDPVVAIEPLQGCCGYLYLVPMGERVTVPAEYLPAHVVWSWRDNVTPDQEWDIACVTDINKNGDCGTDQDITAFFVALSAGTGSADFNGDGSPGTDADIDAFFDSL